MPNVGLPRQEMASILVAALEAVEPGQAVRRALVREADALKVGSAQINLRKHERILLLAAGKAAAPMVHALEILLQPEVASGRVTGVGVTKYGHALGQSGAIGIIEAAHPLPDENALTAGEQMLTLAGSATARDLVFVLLSGGGSALLEALPGDISLDDLQATTSLLLASGATITELNTVRKHLSRIKGGQVARAIAPARMITLVLSDVVGSPLDAIASGPNVPDSTTWADVEAVLERYALWERLPDAVAEYLQRGVRGELPDTPKEDDPCFAGAVVQIVGDNRMAALAAQAKARELGMDAEIVTNSLEGEASVVAREIVKHAGALRADAPDHQTTKLLIYGGETTVTLGDNPGKGGRNQELALAAALALEGTTGTTLIALATDGTDGPTDVAGGWVDGETVARMREQGVNVEESLARHDAYHALEAASALLGTGPTRTNVNDLILVFIEPAPLHS